MTKYAGIIEIIHLNPNKNIKAQRDVGGYGWSLAGEKNILRSAKVSDTRTRLTFLSCTYKLQLLLWLALWVWCHFLPPPPHYEVKL